MSGFLDLVDFPLVDGESLRRVDIESLCQWCRVLCTYSNQKQNKGEMCGKIERRKDGARACVRAGSTHFLPMINLLGIYICDKRKKTEPVSLSSTKKRVRAGRPEKKESKWPQQEGRTGRRTAQRISLCVCVCIYIYGGPGRDTSPNSKEVPDVKEPKGETHPHNNKIKR